MASDRPEESLLTWLEGYRSPDESQADFHRGDPQQAALAQFLSDRKLSANQIVVDFGSGRGLLAQMLKQIYREGEAPRYFAVDLPSELEKLSVPASIHNNGSRKITVEDFYASELKRWCHDVAVVVVRNVLHELKIAETCLLFRALNEHLKPASIIYIQDMTDLPRAEERNVGWHLEVFIEFLRDIGVTAEAFGLSSFSGTNWFALTARTTGEAIDERVALEAAIRARENQKREMLASLSRLDARDPNDFVREVKLNCDIASLEFQLSESRPSQKPASDGVDLGFPLIERSTFGPLDFAVAPGADAKATGLVGILSHKRLVDFAALIRTCQREALFSGYSQRSLFQQADIRAALLDIVNRGCKVRIIVAAPESAAARLRASEPLYNDPTQLPRDIRFTIEEAEKFTGLLMKEKGKDYARRQFELRTSPSIPYSSYFIIDDTCFVSMYSQMASGTGAACFVYRAVEEFPSGYFQVLRGDFEARWKALENEPDPGASGGDAK